MASVRARQGGYLLIAIVGFLFAIGVTVLLSQAGMVLFSKAGAYSRTQSAIAKVDDALVAFATVYRRLPCPARPDVDATNPSAGYPNGDADLSNTPSGCSYPTGVVPWRALGMKVDDVTDEWGRLLSYRVYDGARGFTQADGVSAVDCDLTNGSTMESPPNSTTGLCDPDHNTLAASFYAYPTPTTGYQKGFSVKDFNVIKVGVAFMVVSHGPSGRGGYTASGVPLTLPDASSGDYQNTQPPSAVPFVRNAFSAPDIAAGAAGHYDDLVDFMTIADLQARARLSAREWPETSMPGFSAATTANMTSASTDPLNPHFMSTGVGGSGKEFVAVSSGGETQVAFGGSGSNYGAYAGCLWWPLKLNLANTTSRRLLATYVEFAASATAVGSFPGFTMGYLAANGSGGAPTNDTCGTTVALSTFANGAPGDFTIVVASTTGLEVGMNVYGGGIDPAATVLGWTGTAVTLDRANTAAVIGTVDFSNSNLIRRNLGWAGGNLATYFPNRFAVEFDTYADTGIATPMVVPSAADPTRPHLATDFSGVIHGTDAESCVLIGSGLRCDSEVVDFPAVTKTVTGGVGSNNITVTDATGVNGIVHGMQVTGGGVSAGATVTALTGNVVTLSDANVSDFSGSVSFFSISTSGFMQNGLNVFHSMRTEVSPRDCVTPTATGIGGMTTITVSDASRVASGMSVYGTGIASGATVTGISGTTIALSAANTGLVSGTIILGGWAAPVANATGANGAAMVVVDNAAGIFVGDSVSGAGIATGATVTGIAGTTISLSIGNSSDVSGSLTFVQAAPPTRTFVKAWTLSNAGCNASPSNCSSLQNVNAKFTADISADRQFMHSVSCIPTPTTATAYDSLYFGLTTANRALLPTTDRSIIFRRLNASDSTVIQ